MSSGTNHAQEYNLEVEKVRAQEYPACHGKVYLDHGGATLYAKRLIDRFSADLVSNLYGNPHSDSSPSIRSSERISRVRRQTLSFLNADPEKFDVLFTANATDSIKLVMDSFRDLAATSKDGHFWYGYHCDTHTSLVGVREATNGLHTCFTDDEQVNQWLDGGYIPSSLTAASGRRKLGLFAYPGQSNMTGRRLPLEWSDRLRRSKFGDHVYSLLDAAALSTTCPVDLRNPATAPDFMSLSFYKIFGFPDLGALVIRKDSGHILQWRRYFGGGTVDMVTVLQDPFHKAKDFTTDAHYELHDQLEDGTLPFHNIIALEHALDVHGELFGDMQRVSMHTQYLMRRMHEGVCRIKHLNGLPLCRIYTHGTVGDPSTQGATLAFNIQRTDGSLVSFSLVERTADAHGIYLRSGGLCNPGGVATYLDLAPWEMKRAWSAGHRCGHAIEVVNGKPTGVVRASLGAMSTKADVDTFVAFMQTEGMALAGDDGDAASTERIRIQDLTLAKSVTPNTLVSRKISGPNTSSTAAVNIPISTTTENHAATPNRKGWRLWGTHARKALRRPRRK